MNSLQVFFKLIVTKIDPKYWNTYDNYREFDNIHLQQDDRERKDRKQTVNTGLDRH